MKKCFLFLELWLLLFQTLPCRAENVGRISLQQAIELALKKNPAIKSHQARLDSAKARACVFRSGYFPKVSVSGRLQKRTLLSDTQPAETANLLGQPLLTTLREEKDVNQGGVSLSLSQEIFDFGRRYYTLQQGKSSLRASDAGLAMAKSRVIFEVEQAFYRYFQAVNLLDVARESVRQFEFQLQRAKVRNETGLAPLIDVTTARVNLATAKSRLQQAEADVVLAKAALTNVIGLDPADEYEPIETLKASKPPGEAEELVRMMLHHHPLIRQAKENVRLAQFALKAAESEYWPKISGQVNYLAEGEELPLEEERLFLSLQIDIPLFSGGADYYRIREARFAVQESEALLEQTIRQARLALIEDVTNYQKTLSQLESLEEAGKAAEANLELASARYEIGLGDIIEWTNASLNLIITKTDYVNANYSLQIILAKLKQDVGVSDLWGEGEGK